VRQSTISGGTTNASQAEGLDKQHRLPTTLKAHSTYHASHSLGSPTKHAASGSGRGPAHYVSEHGVLRKAKLLRCLASSFVLCVVCVWWWS